VGWIARGGDRLGSYTFTMENTTSAEDALGSNSWLVEEMRAQHAADPNSVSQEWRDYFAGPVVAASAATATATVAPTGSDATPVVSSNGNHQYSASAADELAKVMGDSAPEAPAEPAPRMGAPLVSVPAAPQHAPIPDKEPGTNGASAAAAPPAAVPVSDEEPKGRPIRGAAARIVANMEASLEVPTATSYREVPAKLLEVNRSIINRYLTRNRLPKVSYTHIIAWAAVRAVFDHVPVMNSTYFEDDEGKPRVINHEQLGLGIAVDLEKSDGSRTLMVPSITDAGNMTFGTFVDVYNEIIARARKNKLTLDDFQGTTMSITNPGGIGTLQSVPRLMPGQGLIVGVGSINFPTEFQAADPRKIAELGVSKVVTLSSTYDHRIIQGAESGLFLKKMHELLIGQDEFYESLFRDLSVPYDAAEFRRDVMPVNHEQAMLEKQMQVHTLVNMHRVRGHLIADIDPLGLKELQSYNELDPHTYGLTIWDLDREFLVPGLTGIEAPQGRTERMPLRQILDILQDAYTRTVGIDYMHIQNLEEKRWIQQQVEGVELEPEMSEKLHILGRLNAAEALESFLDKKYPGQKRFGIQGAESAIPILDAILSDAADASMQSAVIGMAHRGRLNVLVNIVGKSYDQLFEEFEVGVDKDAIQGSGDVKYHLGMDGTYLSPAGNSIPLTLAANPSHLEAINPVVGGIARARMDSIEPPGDYPVLPLLIHGDAAFAGQGVVAESLSLSEIKGYRLGGTVHLVINNQVGFTTVPEQARSTIYPTDVARMVQAPIFHVNGDDPEACARVAHLAFAYRQKFNKDVVIDLWCYRRQGHNEGDDPSYTQPLMYQRIDELPSTRTRYVQTLARRGDITRDEAEAAMSDFDNRLQASLDTTRGAVPAEEYMAAAPAGPVGVLPPAHTAVSREVVDRIYEALVSIPTGFSPHPKLSRQFERRAELFESGRVDWALAEAMAFGSLLDENTSVRLTGQDSSRGTFSHRHSTLVDHITGNKYQPLAQLARPGTHLWIYDSLLSEYACLGFEYGYSVENPEALVIWEAQFGDFMNGAQIIIDQFIVAAEDKWDQHSGLVMMLPHGMEGQGPEHSSARIERFLLLAAEDNIQVVNASNAAQLFHVLRRQMHREVRKPLILFTPKSQLRARSAQSPIDDLITGHFHELLDDPNVTDSNAIKRVVLCSGKVAVEAMAERDKLDAPVAVVRVEQLYPWPTEALDHVLSHYPNVSEIVWLQEEPENMGAWNFAKGHLYEPHGDTYKIRRISRPESGSPATGSNAVHKQEQAQLLAQAVTVSDS